MKNTGSSTSPEWPCKNCETVKRNHYAHYYSKCQDCKELADYMREKLLRDLANREIKFNLCAVCADRPSTCLAARWEIDGGVIKCKNFERYVVGG